MKKVTILVWIGLFIFMLGIYLSTYLSTHWVIIGTSLAIVGCMIMGSSSYFFPKK